jgi:hypothetical protein
MKPTTCAFFAVIVMGPHAGATNFPGGPGFDAITWPMSMRSAPARGINLGDYRIRFERTPLRDVMAKMGVGTILHSGDGAEGTEWLCYTRGEPGHMERLWLLSNSEMDSGTVGAIQAVSLTAQEIPVDCPRLPTQFTTVSLEPEMWLGATTADLEKRFGRPSHKQGAWQSYDFQTKVPVDGKCDGGYDRSSTLDVRTQDGIIVQIGAGQGTSC